jgi:predicted O-methyltransferase YrrM
MIDAPTHFEEVLPIASEEKQKSDALKAYATQCMSQLHGWCSPEKGSFLVDLVLKTKPDTIVEIGVWGGKSFLPMAMALKENQKGVAYGIDPWSSKESTQWVTEEVNKNFWEWANHDLVYNHLNEKIDLFGLRNQIILIKSTSEAAPPIGGIDILHIDGNHSEHTSLFDVEKWVPLVKSGGWIIFDDMKWYENGVFTTAKAGAWLDANCHKFAEFTDICTWGVWIKP